MKAIIRQLGRRLLSYIDMKSTHRADQAPFDLLMPPASMGGADFVVSLITAPQAIVIAVSVSRRVRGDVVNAFMTRLASAVGHVEAVDTALVEEQLFENRRAILGDKLVGILVRRAYSDPEYPLLVARALRNIDINPVEPLMTASEGGRGTNTLC